jgi:hypothetical protein
MVVHNAQSHPRALRARAAHFAGRWLVRTGLVVALIAPVSAACTRTLAQAPALASASPPQGIFRGTLATKSNAADGQAFRPESISGTASWRLELDSLDWRRKLTLRIELAGGRGVYVIRTSGPNAPRRVLTAKNVPSSHIDPAYFTASMVVRENEGLRVYNEWHVVIDTVAFASTDSLFPSMVLRGAVRLEGYRDAPDAPGAHPRQIAVRLLIGTFEAPFDPRPAPTPSTMTAALQREILERALYNFAITWMSYRVTPSAADSTTDNDKARAFLTRRWGEAVIVDSVAVDATHLRVRLHGRYVPIVCVLDERKAGSTCAVMPMSH